MKLTTLRNGKPDGELAVVSRDLARCRPVPDIAPTLQAALDEWADTFGPVSSERYRGQLNAGGEQFDPRQALSPLPRAYQWCDGSVYEAHMERMAKWIRKPVDPRFFDEPWMYQGASDGFLAPTRRYSRSNGRMGHRLRRRDRGYHDQRCLMAQLPRRPAASIALVMLCNDVSLRNLIPPELVERFWLRAVEARKRILAGRGYAR